MNREDFVPVEVYGDGGWHEPLPLSADLEARRSDKLNNLFARKHGNFTISGEQEAVAAWNTEEVFSGTLTMNYFLRSLSIQNSQFMYGRLTDHLRTALLDADVTWGELTYISCRMPNLLLMANEMHIYDFRKYINGVSRDLRGMSSHREESSLAWVLLLGLVFGTDFVEIIKQRDIARKAGLDFDTVAQYMRFGIEDINVIANMVKNDIDPQLAAKL